MNWMNGKTKTAKRLAKMGSIDIINWCDVAGTGVFRALDDYRRLNMEESLLEAEQGLTTLLEAVVELKTRHLQAN